jgi:hypothetical protein
MSSVERLLELATQRPGLTLLVLVLLVLLAVLLTFITVLNRMEQAQQLAAWILRPLRRFPSIRRKQVEFDIEGHVNHGVNQIQTAAIGGLELPKVRIEWVDVDTETSALKEGTLVLRIRRADDNSQSITAVAMAVARDGVIRDAGSYVSDELERGLEVSVTRELLKTMRDEVALRRYSNDVVRPMVQDDAVAEHLRQLETVQESGLLSRCLLVELAALTARIYPNRIKDENIVQETRQFVQFLHDYCRRDYGVTEAGLDFLHYQIAVGFVIVAKQGKLEVQGLRPYIARVLRCFGDGANTVYVSAFGRAHEAARSVADRVLLGSDDAGNPVFRRDGERRFRATYMGETQDVLLLRISKMRPVHGSPKSRRQTSADTAGGATAL